MLILAPLKCAGSLTKPSMWRKGMIAEDVTKSWKSCELSVKTSTQRGKPESNEPNSAVLKKMPTGSSIKPMLRQVSGENVNKPKATAKKTVSFGVSKKSSEKPSILMVNDNTAKVNEVKVNNAETAVQVHQEVSSCPAQHATGNASGLSPVAQPFLWGSLPPHTPDPWRTVQMMYPPPPLYYRTQINQSQ